MLRHFVQLSSTSRPLAAWLALVVLILAGAPSSAEAGVYTVYSCRTPAGTPAPTDGWSSTESADDSVALTSACETGGPLTFHLLGRWTYDNGQGSTAAFQLGIPGLALGDSTVWRSVSLRSPDDGTSVFSLVRGGGPARNIEALGSPVSAGTDASPFDPANRLAVPISANAAGTFSDTAGITARVSCANPQQTYCGAIGGYKAVFNLWAAALQIQDSVPPAISSATGDLLSNGAPTATVSGAPSVVVQASDIGSGLYRLVLTVDGADTTSARFSDNGGRCAIVPGTTRAFLYRQPCPAQSSASLSWDTTTVPAGSHAVQVLVEDASGNRSVVASGRTTVGNTAVGPGSPLAARGANNGTPATDAAVLRVDWPSTRIAPRTDHATVRRCARHASYRLLHPLWCAGAPARDAASRAWSSKKPELLAGTLTDRDGTPIVGANLLIDSTPSAVGATPARLAVVTTDEHGAFTTPVPRNTGSQTLNAQWRARANDGVASATASATLSVRASTTSAFDRTIRHGHAVTFHGTLRSRAGLLDRVPVSLQVQVGTRWQTFASVPTDATGAWRFRRTFHTRGHFRIRVLVGSVPSYLWAASRPSSPVRLTVR